MTRRARAAELEILAGLPPPFEETLPPGWPEGGHDPFDVLFFDILDAAEVDGAFNEFDNLDRLLGEMQEAVRAARRITGPGRAFQVNQRDFLRTMIAVHEMIGSWQPRQIAGFLRLGIAPMLPSESRLDLAARAKARGLAWLEEALA